MAESMFARKRSRTYRVVKNLILVAVATALLALYAYFVYTKVLNLLWVVGCCCCCLVGKPTVALKSTLVS